MYGYSQRTRAFEPALGIRGSSLDKILEGIIMSKETVAAFYAFLERSPEVKQEALTLQDRFEEQEDRINELIRIAEQNGFVFTVQDFVEFLYERSV